MSFAAIGSALGAIGGTIGGAAAGVGSAIGGAASAAGGALASGASAAGSAIGSAASTAGQALGSAISPSASGATSATPSIASEVGGLAKSAVGNSPVGQVAQQFFNTPGSGSFSDVMNSTFKPLNGKYPISDLINRAQKSGLLNTSTDNNAAEEEQARKRQEMNSYVS